MKRVLIAIFCFTAASFAFAEEPGHDCAQMMKQHDSMKASMDAMDAKLQGLVETMNKATGAAKLDAMSAVITELVAQRTAMREQMASMQPMMMAHMHEGGEGHSMKDCPMMKGKK